MDLELYRDRRPFADDDIIGRVHEDRITVYQAYHPGIATYAVEHQTFGDGFSFNRMSWIKPSFLWMMHRAGWASKPNQERILAIDIRRSFLDELIQNAALTSGDVTEREVLIQLDPDRDPDFRPLARRAIQIGLRGSFLHRFAKQEILQITDITSLALQDKADLRLPREVKILSHRELLKKLKPAAEDAAEAADRT